MMISDFFKERKITITEAAKRLDISRITLSKIINGKSSLTPKITKRFDAVFGLPAQELLEEQASQMAKKQFISPVSSLCQSNPFFQIDSLDIERWAKEIDTRKRLPQLIRILILSTSKSITEMGFPANEDSQRRGFDGKLHAQEPHPWIPLGASYWEMGVNKNPKTKLASDLKKSTKKLISAQRKESVFVFVTPRRFESQQKDLDELKAKYGWKDIRILDASILEQWVECSVEAQVWLLKQLKRDTAGVETLRDYWEEWISPLNKNPFPPALFDELVNEFSGKVYEFFSKDEKSHCSIAADSEGEASAFLFHTLEKFLGKKNCPTEIAAKQILLFNTTESVKAIPLRPNNIIAVTSNETVKRKLLEHPNARFIWIETTDQKRQQCDIVLHPTSRDSLFKAAESAGLSDSDALEWENVSCGSIAALHRFISGSDSSLYPSWAKNESDINALIPMLFAGAWQTSDAFSDWKTVCELNADETSERSLEKNLAHFTNLENSPLWQETTMCGVKSKRDLFLICKSWIVQSDCENAFSVIRKALTTPPGTTNHFETAPSDEKHISSLLRKNLADTLVLLARNAQSIQACKSFEIREEIDKTVTGILKHWDKASFNAYDDCLESFALAAPGAFLDFWESHPEPCQWMMCPVTNPFFEKSPRPAFLDALKILCWEEATFERAVCLLAKLARIEPKDNLGNKPSRSLQFVFSAFFVHTGVSTQTRIRLLKRLTTKDPDTFWEICLEDCVNHPPIGSWDPPPVEIRFKDYRTCADFKDSQAMLNAKVNLIFSGVFDWTSERVTNLFDIFEVLSDEKKDAVLAIAKNWSQHATDAERERLREHINLRMEYAFKKPDSHVSRTQIRRLKEFCQTLTAKTEEGKLLFLFSSEAFHQAYRKRRDSRQIEKHLGKERKAALRHWKAAHGIKGLVQLMARTNVTVTQSMAGYCSSFLSDKQMATLICEALKADMEHTHFRKMLIGLLFTPKEKVLQLLGKSLSEQELTDVLKSTPPGSETARFVCETLPTYEKTYWETVETTDLFCRNDADAAVVAEKLFSVGRVNDAFAFTWPEHDALSPALLFKLLRGIGNGTDTKTSSFLVNASYEIEKALKAVSASADIAIRDKALLDIKFAPLLVPTGCSDEPPLRSLVDYIWQEPGFLVNLIWLAHKEAPAEKTGENNSLDQNQLQAIVHTLIVLNFDDQSPESERKKKLDYRQWTESFVELAEQRNIRPLADYRLGEILGRHNRWRLKGSRDKKQPWFNPDYCEMMETIGTDAVFQGLSCGLFNAIGVRTRTLNGDTERDIAESFKKEVEKTKDYPKVQRVFKDLQKEFEENAETEDENLRKMQRTRFFNH